MKILEDGRVQVRVRITGTYRGTPWQYEDSESALGSQFYYPPTDHKDNWSRAWEPSCFWWAEGNMSCDCNRSQFLNDVPDDCGDEILIDRIEPLEGDLPALILDESTKGKA